MRGPARPLRALVLFVLVNVPAAWLGWVRLGTVQADATRADTYRRVDCAELVYTVEHGAPTKKAAELITIDPKLGHRHFTIDLIGSLWRTTGGGRPGQHMMSESMAASECSATT